MKTPITVAILVLMTVAIPGQVEKAGGPVLIDKDREEKPPAQNEKKPCSFSDWTAYSWKTAMSWDVKSCIAAGADPDGLLHGRTPLHWAVQEDNGMAVEILLDGGADPNIGLYGHEFGDKPLHWAVNRGGVMMIKSLLNAGADPNALDQNRETPLQIAKDKYDLVREVLEAHLMKTGRGGTPAVQSDGDCSIPGYMEAHRSGDVVAFVRNNDWKFQGLPWCPTGVPFQVRSIALKIAVAQCGLATSEGAAPEKIQTRKRQIRESCAQLNALDERLGGDDCRCPTNLVR